MKSPIRIFVIVASAAFFCEVLLMLVLTKTDVPHSYWLLLDSSLLVLLLSPVIYVFVYQPLFKQFEEQRRLKNEKEEIVEQLEKALGEIRLLKGIIPICAHCKKIRDDQGFWNQVESYIQKHSAAEFSHSICPDCRKKHY
jgi:hypothetical protein